MQDPDPHIAAPTEKEDLDPIFFLWTRSFWLMAAAAVMSTWDVVLAATLDPVAGAAVARFIAALVSALPMLPDVSADQVTTSMRVLAALCAIFAVQQRAGSVAHPPRPYTIDPRALK